MGGCVLTNVNPSWAEHSNYPRVRTAKQVGLWQQFVQVCGFVLSSWGPSKTDKTLTSKLDHDDWWGHFGTNSYYILHILLTMQIETPKLYPSYKAVVFAFICLCQPEQSLFMQFIDYFCGKCPWLWYVLFWLVIVACILNCMPVGGGRGSRRNTLSGQQNMCPEPCCKHPNMLLAKFMAWSYPTRRPERDKRELGTVPHIK